MKCDRQDEYIRAILAAKEKAEAELAKLKGMTYCAYCGTEFPCDGDAEDISNHIKTCTDHPMRLVEAERDRLQNEYDRVATLNLMQANKITELIEAKERTEAELAECRKGLNEFADQCDKHLDEIGRLEAIKLTPAVIEPGKTYVLRFPGKLPERTLIRIKKQWKSQTSSELIVLEDGLDLVWSVNWTHNLDPQERQQGEGCVDKWQEFTSNPAPTRGITKKEEAP